MLLLHLLELLVELIVLDQFLELLKDIALLLLYQVPDIGQLLRVKIVQDSLSLHI